MSNNRKTMPTYFIFRRKSTEAEDRQILSIDPQVIEMKRLAAERGLKIATVLTEAKSAKALGRPMFNAMMELLYRGGCWRPVLEAGPSGQKSG
jgi:site-specific DNA recombinase